MLKRQPALPAIWLISDARNDVQLARVLNRLPRGSGFIFRHYHLAFAERHARFRALARISRRRGHAVVLAGNARLARRWGADGGYGPRQLLARGPALPRFITTHSLGEIGHARRARADAILLSPVFPTRSHPGARTLGALQFRLLAAWSGVPAIALGGMTAHRAKRLKAPFWAAIDGICAEATRPIPKDS